MKEYLLTAFPNPERTGCPDEKTLKALAERNLALSDPAMLHVCCCSECYAEYLNYRIDLEEMSGKFEVKRTPLSRLPRASAALQPTPTKRTNTLPWAIVATVVIILGGALIFGRQHRASSSSAVLVASSPRSPISANLDLFDAVTVRGGGEEEPTPLQQQVSLPSSIIHLLVTLPRFSQIGPYQILVSKDRAGKGVIARGLGNAVEADNRVSLIVTLDLRNAAPGMYFLATVRDADNGTYYYPLKVN